MLLSRHTTRGDASFVAYEFSKEPGRFLFSYDALRSECVEMCWRRACFTVVQHCRYPPRDRQDAANNEKEFPGTTEGGKGAGGEREGLAQTLPECRDLFVLFACLRSCVF